MEGTRNLRVFGACLGSAVIFWLFNALHQTYVTPIHCPVQFTPRQSQDKAIKAPPTDIVLEVEDTGWVILRYLIRFRIKPVVIRTPVRPSTPEEMLLVMRKRLKKIKINKLVTDPKPAASN